MVGATIEQDAAYWELVVELEEGASEQEIMFGVATKKDPKFYAALQDQEGGTCLY